MPRGRGWERGVGSLSVKMSVESPKGRLLANAWKAGEEVSCCFGSVSQISR